jgi:hypothetical protein
MGASGGVGTADEVAGAPTGVALPAPGCWLPLHEATTTESTISRTGRELVDQRGWRNGIGSLRANRDHVVGHANKCAAPATARPREGQRHLGR